MSYHTEPKVRKRIDALLEQNARNMANFKTKSKYDLRTKEAFNKAWREILREIKSLDEAMYRIVKRQDD